MKYWSINIIINSDSWLFIRWVRGRKYWDWRLKQPRYIEPGEYNF